MKVTSKKSVKILLELSENEARILSRLLTRLEFNKDSGNALHLSKSEISLREKDLSWEINLSLKKELD